MTRILFSWTGIISWQIVCDQSDILDLSDAPQYCSPSLPESLLTALLENAL